MSAKQIVNAKNKCTSRPNCPCAFCGQVRLLIEHEEQRHAAMPCQICASEAMRAELVECPICGAPGTLPEIEALALKFIEDYLKEKP